MKQMGEERLRRTQIIRDRYRKRRRLKKMGLVISKNERGIIGFSDKSRGRGREMGLQTLHQTELIRWTDRKLGLREGVKARIEYVNTSGRQMAQ